MGQGRTATAGVRRVELFISPEILDEMFRLNCTSITKWGSHSISPTGRCADQGLEEGIQQV